MKTIYISCLLLSLSFYSVISQNTRFEKANTLYSEAKFEEAISAYNAILSSGTESSELYYNLGNTYYKAGELPRAILNFERALLLNPNDKDIKYNLELSYSQTVDKIEPVGELFIARWVQNWRNLMDSDGWTTITIVAFFIFIGLIALFIFTNKSSLKQLSFFFGILVLMINIFTFFFAKAQKNKLENRANAIVFSPSVTIKSSPDYSGNDLFILHEGTRVKIINTLGSWKEVEIKNGNQGWVSAEALEVI